MKIKHKILFIIANLICTNLNSSCNILSGQSCTIPTNISTIPIESLLSSPDNIEINGNKIKLQIFLRRNFAVYVGDHSNSPHCLIAYISIFSNTTNYSSLPTSYKAERFWVINEEKKVWETNLLNKSLQDRIDINGGPEWPYENKLYSVVIKFNDGMGKTYFIKLEKIKITITI